MSLESNDPALHELPSGKFNVDGENMHPNKAQTVHRGGWKDQYLANTEFPTQGSLNR